LLFSFIISILGVAEFSAVEAQETFPCVWRNPERTMKKIFPEAGDYKSINRTISAAERKEIEKELGKELLPGQQDVFTYYEMTDKKGKVIGYIMAPAQKGEYGVIEFVFGLNTEKKIVDIYVQRSRERENKFKEREFLDKFIGKSVKEYSELQKMIMKDTSFGEMAIIDGVKKELLLIDRIFVNHSVR
jgi:Na+-translocating ferredoxin:NAD+ oxidoreductase RnfG subunit